jgi:organic hydroperoxide reductase OsmC/OhrA
VLERVAQRSEFTRYTTVATLTVPAGTDTAKATKLLERAEHGCLIANSLRGARALKAEIIGADPAVATRVIEPSELVS